MINKAEKYDKLTREVIAPVFPEIADQFIETSGIHEGLCLDLGCGNGYLGLALAEKSTLDVYLIDIDAEMLAVAERNLNDRNLGSRVKVLLADVHKMPFESNFADIIVSRGSVFFWQDQPKAFCEIYRVLAPGGKAFIGGGFGNSELKKQIDQEMQKRNPDWFEHLNKNIGPDAPDKFRSVLSEAGITNYHIDYGPVGLWVVLSKDK